MSFNPPVLVVLDISALSAGTNREWLEFSRIGEVHIPQSVYEEMKFLYGRTPDPDLESLARAFHHFYPTSTWKITEATAHHPSLTAAAQALTKRARIALAAARCAYALSLSHSSYLTVLATNDRGLLQKVYEIPSNNFCAIDAPSLIQWCRSGQRPISVSQKLQQMRATVASGIITQPQTSASRIVSTSARSTTAVRHRSRPITKPVQPSLVSSEAVSQFISLMMALGGVLMAGWLLWAVISGSSFLEPWRQPVSPTEKSG
ncbi:MULTISPECIES: hypothetical protein [unclassified Leptolyngbya]|uniref:hypothetical protein n=1 Tax=unclassified Leptolyngbya TaxID=2650499 RepID=UPI00168855CA|nr:MULTISPECIES: hypothetical protein [unclassified Leptolyngbya]MBD1911205.1 hypothetical protein [Leptolyngbya sp. FACHB-8]MBD2155452.1 hypothetical protein [Leptolyngbya sp. FACHB-16]